MSKQLDLRKVCNVLLPFAYVCLGRHELFRGFTFVLIFGERSSVEVLIASNHKTNIFNLLSSV